MSKVVKKAGRAIGKVVSGVSKVVKGVVSGVKKFANSKIGKAIITAAAVYFGGAALAGGFGSSAAGGSFLSGMGTGVANAASSLSTAWGSALSGNFAQAGSALSSGFQGQAAGSALANAGASATQAAAGEAAFTGATSTGLPTVAGDTANVLASQSSGNGLISSAWNSLGDRSKAALLTGSAQLAGGAIQGAGQQKVMEGQRDYEAQQLAAQNARYKSSVDQFLAQANAGAAATSQPQVGQPTAPTAYDPVADARARRDRMLAMSMGVPYQPGLVGGNMQAAPGYPLNTNYYG